MLVLPPPKLVQVVGFYKHKTRFFPQQLQHHQLLTCQQHIIDISYHHESVLPVLLEDAPAHSRRQRYKAAPTTSHNPHELTSSGSQLERLTHIPTQPRRASSGLDRASIPIHSPIPISVRNRLRLATIYSRAHQSARSQVGQASTPPISRHAARAR